MNVRWQKRFGAKVIYLRRENPGDKYSVVDGYVQEALGSLGFELKDQIERGKKPLVREIIYIPQNEKGKVTLISPNVHIPFKVNCSDGALVCKGLNPQVLQSVKQSLEVHTMHGK